MAELTRISGEVIDVSEMSELNDYEFIDLLFAVEAETRRRTGRCAVCGHRHDRFDRCKDTTIPGMISEEEGEFERALRLRRESSPILK